MRPSHAKASDGRQETRVICYLAVGSNLGDRTENIQQAIKKLGRSDGIKISKISRLYETEPVGGPTQGKYLNGAIEIETDLKPRELLLRVQKIEEELGRVRTVRNGARTIDLDILIYGNERIDEPDLKIPHPGMRQREFVMKPLREINDSIK